MEANRLKEKFGGRIVLWGGLDVQEILPYGTPQEVEAEVKRIIEVFSPGGGYVFSPAHVIQPDVPLENIFTMFDAAVRYGKYPVKNN